MPFRRAPLALLLALVLAAPAGPAAAEALHLTWGDCPNGVGASAVRTFACEDDLGAERLYCAVVVDQPIDSVLALEVVIDVQHASPTLPDWWRFNVGGCRDGQLSADDEFTDASCTDLWGGAASGGLLSYTPGMPYGGAGQARIRLSLGVPSTQQKTLAAGTLYYAARLSIAHALTTVGCAGCPEDACLVLNSILVRRPIRPVGTGDVFLSTPAVGNGNWVRWQQGGAALCGTVPVRRTTWGQIKSLYR